MRIPFDRVAHIYDKTRGLLPKVMRKIVQALTKELNMDAQKTVLDVGVGTGRFAKPLQDNGFLIVGIDISRDMMHEAKGKGVKNLLFADACFLPFKHAAFDAALSVHVLHLISEWQTALEEICNVTRNGLFSVATMPLRNPISETYDKLAQKKGYNTKHIGLCERKLREIIDPAKSVHAASMISSADEHLAYLKRRAFSRQWRVPKAVDNQIVKALEKRFAGKAYPLEIFILKWNTSDLKTRLESQNQA